MPHEAAATRSASPSLHRWDGDVRLAATAQVPLLITAPTRDHREICARLVHAMSDRARGPFVAWHVDASGAARPGSLQHHFDAARGGTLFIDDLAALSASEQVDLLTILDRAGRWAPWRNGGGADGARIISGAGRPVDPVHASGSFSDALFYRLNIIHIDLTGASGC